MRKGVGWQTGEMNDVVDANIQFHQLNGDNGRGSCGGGGGVVGQL